jgi:hypothetical protein
MQAAQGTMQASQGSMQAAQGKMLADNWGIPAAQGTIQDQLKN